VKPDLDALLKKWRDGDREAGEEVIALVYKDLRALAAHFLNNERPDHTLQPTALVNEVYLRLAEIHAMDWRDRAHFFAMASRLMRRTLVDAARAKRADKRGGSAVRVTFDEAHGAAAKSDHTIDVLALDAALTGLAALDPRKARVVELRFFAGLSVEEAAEATGVSVETIARDWRFARLWLRREMTKGSAVD